MDNNKNHNYIKGIDKVDPNDLLYDTMIDVNIAYIIVD